MTDETTKTGEKPFTRKELREELDDALEDALDVKMAQNLWRMAGMNVVLLALFTGAVFLVVEAIGRNL